MGKSHYIHTKETLPINDKKFSRAIICNHMNESPKYDLDKKKPNTNSMNHMTLLCEVEKQVKLLKTGAALLLGKVQLKGSRRGSDCVSPKRHNWA